MKFNELFIVLFMDLMRSFNSKVIPDLRHGLFACIRCELSAHAKILAGAYSCVIPARLLKTTDEGLQHIARAPWLFGHMEYPIQRLLRRRAAIQINLVYVAVRRDIQPNGVNVGPVFSKAC